MLRYKLPAPSSQRQPSRTTTRIGQHCLKISGTLLDVSVLLDKKKFRSFDNKDGALRGFKKFEEDDLGTLEPRRGTGANKVWLPYV